MAASFWVEDVLEQVLNSNDEEDPAERIEIGDEEASVGSSVESWLDSFPAKEGYNWELFKDISKEIIETLIKQCSSSTDLGELQPAERLKAAKALCTSTLDATSILRSETLLWMQRMKTRPGGRVVFRRPYNGSISRNISYDVFMQGC